RHPPHEDRLHERPHVQGGHPGLGRRRSPDRVRTDCPL
ncbi:MAG: hypothetical protein AVDCRST_MAG29-1441, partial [uncultured Nocardioidaceae bacterium]